MLRSSSRPRPPAGSLIIALLSGTLPALLALGAAGCDTGPDRFPVAEAGGIVLCDGNPLSGGLVMFNPQMVGEDMNAGKQARAYIKPDGTFQLGTYEGEDGAVIGTHKVIVQALRGGDEDDDERSDAGLGGCDGRPAELITVTADGDNQFMIELNPDR